MILYNEKQLKCIEHPPAPLMIIAGAGTGKTTTIIGRIAYFIKERDIPPESILALTYTVKAANYLSDSIEKIVGEESNKINSSNFHSFAFDLVIKYYKELGYKKMPKLIEPNDSKYIIKQLINANLGSFKSIDYKKDNKIAFTNIPKLFDRFRDELILDEFLSNKINTLLDNKDRDENSNQLIDCINLYFIYQNYKKDNSLIDFGDMISKLWELLNNNSILSEIQSNIKHIIVDEYQDNNYALSQIVKKISSKESSITVVGDDDQSIYSFRGANVIGFQEFRDYFKNKDNYSEIILDINYRSTQGILNFSNETVKSNSLRFKDTPLTSNKSIDSEVFLFTGDRNMQLSKIVKISKEHIAKGAKASEICILTRTANNALQISDYLNLQNIKNSYASGKLFEKDIVKDFISFINVIFNGKYFELGLYRLISNSKYSDLLKSQGSLVGIKNSFKSGTFNNYNNDFFHSLYLDSQVLKSVDFLDHFKTLSNKFLKYEYDDVILSSLFAMIENYRNTYSNMDGSICEYFNTMFELNEVYIDTNISDSDSISVMNIHQSKGMEFKYVIIPFLASGSFPTRKRSIKNLEELPNDWLRNSQLCEIDSMEEERRIFHVASTRAKDKLYLLAPDKGKSKFFKEINKDTYSELILTESDSLTNKVEEFNFSYSSKLNFKFSATNLSLYESCPLAFKYEKIDKIKTKDTSPAAALGKFIHRALEIAFEEKNANLDDIKRIIKEIWDKDEFSNIYQSNEYAKEAEAILYEYINKNPLDSNIEYVFEKEIVATENSNTFIGKIDRIDFLPNGDISILDYKTSKNKKTPKQIIKDIQLGYYAYLLSISKDDDLNLKFPVLSSLEFVRDAKSPSVSVSFTKQNILEIRNRIDGIVKSVSSNNFSPKKGGHCFFCDYKRLLCPLYK